MRIPKRLPPSQIQKPTQPLPPKYERNLAASFQFTTLISALLGQILANWSIK